MIRKGDTSFKLLVMAAGLALVASEPAAAGGEAQALVDRLKAPDAAARAEAACELGRRPGAAATAVPALAKLLADDLRVGPVECGMSPWLRQALEKDPAAWRQFETSPGREAARALARLGPPAIPLLLQALAGPQAPARAHAAFALGEMKPGEERERVLAGLHDALRDGQDLVREAAARALGEIDDRSSVSPLLGTLRDRATKVRATAAWALGELEDPAAVESLMRAASDAEAEVRRQAVWALGEIEDPRATPVLAKALRDPAAGVRAQAAWALGEIDDPAAVPALLGALRDDDGRVRAQAAWALGEIEAPGAVEGLSAALHDADPGVREKAAWALGEIGDPRAASPLASALKDRSVEVRRQAAWALGEIRD